MEFLGTELGTRLYKPVVIAELQRPREKHANFCKKNPDRKMELIPYTPGSFLFKPDPNFRPKNSEQTGAQTQSKGKKREKKLPAGTFADTILQTRDSFEPNVHVPIAIVLQPAIATPISQKDNTTQTPLSFSNGFPDTTEVDNNGSPLRKRRLFMDRSPVTTREDADLSPFVSPSPLKRVKTSHQDPPPSPFAMNLALAQSPGEMLSRLPSTVGDEGEVLEEFYTTKPNIDNSQT